MSTDFACQTFELKRLPELRDSSVRIWLFYLAFLAFKHWLLALAIMGLVVIYVFWRLRSPVECLRLSDKEIHMGLGWGRFIRIDKQLVEEVSPASKGVIIAWKKSGVPVYTELRSSWFSEEVWQRAYPALLSWGAEK